MLGDARPVFLDGDQVELSQFQPLPTTSRQMPASERGIQVLHEPVGRVALVPAIGTFQATPTLDTSRSHLVWNASGIYGHNLKITDTDIRPILQQLSDNCDSGLRSAYRGAKTPSAACLPNFAAWLPSMPD